LETSSQENYFVACEIFNSINDKNEKQFNCLIKLIMYQIAIFFKTYGTKKYLIIKCNVPLGLSINEEYVYIQIIIPKPKWVNNEGYDTYEALHENPKENIFEMAYCLMDPQRRWDKLSGLL